jgi:hypothetical protein
MINETYTFVTTPMGMPNEIVIGSTAAITAANIAVAINNTYGAVFVATAANEVVTIIDYTTDIITKTKSGTGLSLSAVTQEVIYTSSSASATLSSFTGQGTVIDMGILTGDYGLSTIAPFTGAGTAIDTGNTGFSFLPSFRGGGYSRSLFEPLEETIGIMGFMGTASVLFFDLDETLFAYDDSYRALHLTISDTFDAKEPASPYSPSVILGLLISDSLTVNDIESNNWKGVEVLNEIVQIYNAFEAFRYEVTVTDTFDAKETTLHPRIWLVLPVNEVLTLSESVPASISFIFSVADGLTATDASKWSFDFTIADTFAFLDAGQALSSRALFNTVIADVFNAVDTSVPICIYPRTLLETMGIADTSSNIAKLQHILEDNFGITITIVTSGGIYECWSLSTPKFHLSIYSGFDFNSYCSFNNRAYGANSTGIYELTGTTDAGSDIHTGVVFSESTLGIPTGKRLRKAYLGYSGGTPVLVLEVEDGTRKVFNVTEQSTVIGNHDVRGRVWKLSIANFESLDSLNLIPLVLTK